MMAFLFLMIFGFVHMTMFMATKSLANYAAFSAARTAMTMTLEGLLTNNPQAAATEVIKNLQWWDAEPDCGFSLGPGGPEDKCVVRPWFRIAGGPLNFKNRTGVEVRYRVPFGLPIFNDVQDGGIAVVGFAPVELQPSVPNEGDNRDALNLGSYIPW